MTSARSEALVATDRPARYGKQLIAHLGRRNGGDWSDADERGTIQLSTGQAALTCRSGGLHLSITGAADDLPTLEDVVGRHLVRFGTRDELVVQWVRDNDEPGTLQRNDSAS